MRRPPDTDRIVLYLSAEFIFLSIARLRHLEITAANFSLCSFMFRNYREKTSTSQFSRPGGISILET